MAKPKPVGFPPEGEELPSPVADNHTHFTIGADAAVELPEGVESLPMDVQIARAARAGVVAMIHSGCELPGLQAAVDLARAHDAVAAAIAIHPNEAPRHAGVREVGPDGWEPRFLPHHETDLDDAVGRVAEIAEASRGLVVAIGETGLDNFRAGDKGRAVQRRAFRAHIEIAKELGLPLQIHDREAHAEVLDVLRRDGAPERTVFHCFSGDRELAEIVSRNGWYASFAGPITFRTNDELRDACRHIDPSRVLVETDAPYLTPAPYRGRPNAPYLMTHTVRAIAQALELELTQACQVLMANTRRVYGQWWS